jgi:2-polyprenyl-6-methoxyphenol hydroxylase-like FAD-dependent oxidoreductase
MTRVAIIGGGIGGLTAANALARAGIEVGVEGNVRAVAGQALVAGHAELEDGRVIEDGAVLATALSAEPSDPVTGLARYERTRRPRASRVVLAARERGLSNHLTSGWARLAP